MMSSPHIYASPFRVISLPHSSGHDLVRGRSDAIDIGRQEVIAALGGVAVAWASAARAQQGSDFIKHVRA
jgi:hypothetical protein